MENEEYFEKMERAIRRKMKLKKKMRDKEKECYLLEKVKKINKNICSTKQVYFQEID